MKYHLRQTLRPQFATYEELCTLLAETEACLNSRPCVPYLMILSIQHICPLDIFWLVNHLPIYLLLTLLMSNARSFQCGKPTNHKYNSSGSDGHPTTSRACNNIHAGWRYLLTYSLVPSSCWRKTTQLHYMAHSRGHQHPSRQRWHSSICHTSYPQGIIKRPLQKFVPYRVKVTNHSVSFLGGVALCTRKGKFLLLLFAHNHCIFMYFFVSPCCAIVAALPAKRSS